MAPSFADPRQNFSCFQLVRTAAIRVREFLNWRARWALCGLGGIALASCVSPSSTTTWERPPKGPVVAVFPFETTSDGLADNAVGEAVAEDLVGMLAYQPGSYVNARLANISSATAEKTKPEGQSAHRYALTGTISVFDRKVYATAELIDERADRNLWPIGLAFVANDLMSVQLALVEKTNNTLAGKAKAAAMQGDRIAWVSPRIPLEEHLLYLRGRESYKRGSSQDIRMARSIWSSALSKYPHSSLLKLGVAWTYVKSVQTGQSDDAPKNVEQAWTLATAAYSADLSRFEEWQWQWIMAYLYQWHEGDFTSSTKAAERAVALVPRDPTVRADLAELLTYAGQPDRAIEWLSQVRPPSSQAQASYTSSLAWAYLIADKPAKALNEYKKEPESCPLCLAVTYVRLNELEKARAIVVSFRERFPAYTLKDEATWPGYKQKQMAEPFLTSYLNDLRIAGIPP